jgi:hypothetical protein
VASLPRQLLLDLFHLGSGKKSKISERLVSTSPPEKVLRLRRDAVAYARRGHHWLGPWALDELLTIATNDEEEQEVRENAIGALARALRMSSYRVPRMIDGLSTDSDPAESIIKRARILLSAERRAEFGGA